MATIKVAFDAFAQSAKKEFVQSPNKERNDSHVDWTYGTNTAFVHVGHTKYGEFPSDVPGAYTRDAATQATFLIRRYTVTNTDDPTYGGATSIEYLRTYARDSGTVTNTTTGTANEFYAGYTLVSETLSQDDESGVLYTISYTNGTNTLTQTLSYESPYTNAAVFSDLADLWAAVATDFAGLADSDAKYFHWGAGWTVVPTEDVWWTDNYPVALDTYALAGWSYNGFTNAFGMIGKRYKLTTTSGIGVVFQLSKYTRAYGSDPTATPSDGAASVVTPIYDGVAVFFSPDLNTITSTMEVTGSERRADPISP